MLWLLQTINTRSVWTPPRRLPRPGGLESVDILAFLHILILVDMLILVHVLVLLDVLGLLTALGVLLDTLALIYVLVVLGSFIFHPSVSHSCAISLNLFLALLDLSFSFTKPRSIPDNPVRLGTLLLSMKLLNACWPPGVVNLNFSL